jgi:hypothetical protein
MNKDKVHYIWNFRRTAVHYFFLFLFTYLSIIASYNWYSCVISDFRVCINLYLTPAQLILEPFRRLYLLLGGTENNDTVAYAAILCIFINMIFGILLAKFINHLID